MVTKNSQKLVPTDLRLNGTLDLPTFLPGIPQFVSAPETVRRYIGQGSKSALGREIADLLIRWRPSVHSADYHAPVLDRSESCMPCHSMGMLDAAPEVPRKVFIDQAQRHQGLLTLAAGSVLGTLATYVSDPRHDPPGAAAGRCCSWTSTWAAASWAS